MIPTRIQSVLLCLALAACGDRPAKPAELSQAIPNMPVPPNAKFVRKAAGAEAVQVTLDVPGSPDVVAAYYRDVFTRGSWRLVKEAKDGTGAMVLLAEQDGPPLWVRIRPSGATGSVVEISGAVVSKTDSAAAKPAS